MSGQRENRIDLLRGLSLLLIFIGHAEFTFSQTFQQSRGFSDASEIFVLLAGMSSALAYYRPDMGLQMKRPWRRALRLYFTHLMLFAVMAVVSSLVLAVFHEAVWDGAMSEFWRNPLLRGIQAMSLFFMPGNLDILPMYVVLLLFAPFAFVLHDRSRPALLAVCGAVWLLAGLGHVNFPNVALAGGTWYFDPFSWQLIFVIGICLGIRLKRGETVLPYSRPLFIAAAVFAVAAIPANLAVHFALPEGRMGNLLHQMVSKTNEGPLRIINVLAILYLAWNIAWVQKAANHPSMRLLCIAGRHSLAIFASGLLLAFCVMVLMKVAPGMSLAAQLLLLVGCCAIQLAIGQWLETRKQAVSSQRLSATRISDAGAIGAKSG
ncbi:MAG TPA: OpgC domain-containing protein [Pararhizobium sp.]|uniref:OpgC family protein n=1 Tax=Pararhizobium sp. TaxID=1977563 RepID=UPI002CE1AF7D|nr:OpgC domain-containing protein [Pararhizobium sp.]HTO32912.1 OpgC domain-containing protein [Pararhizobium sp.]